MKAVESVSVSVELNLALPLEEWEFAVRLRAADVARYWRTGSLMTVKLQNGLEELWENDWSKDPGEEKIMEWTRLDVFNRRTGVSVLTGELVL